MSRRAQQRTRTVIALGAAAGVVACGLPVAASAASAATDEPSTPKNVIVLISDGAGYNQFDAARLYSTG